MTVEARQQAPGCFGAASVFSMDSQVCQACVAFKDCGDKAIETLEAIKSTINVADILTRHQAARQKALANKPKPVAPQPIEQSPIPIAQPKPITKPVERKTAMQRVTFEISEADQAVIMRIGEKSVKTKEQAVVLCKQNKINAMRWNLPKGLNPFSTSGPAFLRIACDMLINGGFTKASYKARLVADLSWTDGTAGSHVAIACALLFAFGIVVGKDDSFVLNPALGRDNTSNEEQQKGTV